MPDYEKRFSYLNVSIERTYFFMGKQLCFKLRGILKLSKGAAEKLKGFHRNGNVKWISRETAHLNIPIAVDSLKVDNSTQRIIIS